MQLRIALSFVFFWADPAVAGSAQSTGVGSPDGGTPSDMKGERVRLSEILILTPFPSDQAQLMEAERKAKEASDSIRSGTPFAEAAKANSQGPTAALGGDLGCFNRGHLAHRLEDMVFGMKSVRYLTSFARNRGISSWRLPIVETADYARN